MPPDPAQQARIWKVLKSSPLVQKWPDFQQSVLPHAELREYQPGDFVFRRGDPPLYLFIVVTGRVVMRLQEGGELWFEQILTPGQVFGQQALWDEAYRASARISLRSGPASLLLVSANALRIALERMPDLREELLHETRAGRLRRIPLFRSLEDDQIRWLAQLVEERELCAGDTLDMAHSPGIFIVDRGQVALTGPAHPYPTEWPAWRITAGNFFVSTGRANEPAQEGKAMRFGLNCAADSAGGAVDSNLFYLAAEHADLIITHFPDVGELLHQPLDIVSVLEKAPLFNSLSRRQKQHLAQFAGWEFVPEKQNITTQGQPGHSYVILREGGGLITAFDNYGRERPRSRLQAGASYGRTSLLEGAPRDVTVRAVRGEGSRGKPGLAGADIIVVDRRDFAHAALERRRLWSGVSLAQQIAAKKEIKPEYPWMQEGEIVKWSDRPHPLWLIWPLSSVGLGGALLVALFIFLPPGLLRDTLVLIGAGFLFLLAVVIVLNYLDDYYVITNRRVTRRDRQLFLFEARAEAPVEMIQDVTILSGFWGLLFNYGNVAIRTAAKTAPIRLDNVGRPYEVKELLEETRTMAQADERGRQKEELRQGLIKDLRLALPIPQRQRALGNAPLPGTAAPSWLRRLFAPKKKAQRVPTPPNTRLWLAKHSSHLPASWRRSLASQTQPPAIQKPAQDIMVWRKHWLNAVSRTGLPLLLFILVLVAGVLGLVGGPPGITLTGLGWVLGWILLLTALGAWLWWQFVDYRNDVYILTEDRIIDVEMQPLGINAKRREGGLERVQNVFAKQDGIWAKIFQYGDVIISTAAADEGFTFNMVPNPQLVQTIVFQRLNMFRARDEKRRATQRQQELIEALSVYHQLRGGGPQADSYQ